MRVRTSAATSMVVALMLGALVTTASLAFAETQPDPYTPQASVVDVTSVVDETTPPYHLTLKFQLRDVQCPAVLDYKIGGRIYAGIPIPVCTRSDGSTIASATVTHQRPIFGDTGETILPEGAGCDAGLDGAVDLPGCQAWAYVRTPSHAVNSGYLRQVRPDADPNARPIQVPIPKRPLWVGVGDGYTSQRTQSRDDCNTLPLSTTCTTVGAVLDADHEHSSWIYAAANNFNTNYKIDGASIPCDGGAASDRCWRVKPVVVAADGVSAKSLALGTHPSDQLSAMASELAKHVGAVPSWNWVGLSAGLVDSGIPSRIAATYRTSSGDPYVEGGEAYSATGSSIPWAATSTAQCPDLSGVVATLDAEKTNIENGVKAVVDRARAASPGARVMVVQYPYLTEVQSSVLKPGTTNLCAPANRLGIDRLDEVLGGVVAGYQSAGSLPTVYGLDLRTVFGTEPTGTDSLDRSTSKLQLSRPWGYPYPSSLGTDKMGEAALQAVRSSGAHPPAIAARVVDRTTGAVAAPGPDGWYNGTSANGAVEFHVPVGGAGSGDAHIIEACVADDHVIPGTDPATSCVRPPVGTTSVRIPLVEGANVLYRATVVDGQEQVASTYLLVSFDPAAPVVTIDFTNEGPYDYPAEPPLPTCSVVDPAFAGDQPASGATSPTCTTSLQVVANPEGGVVLTYTASGTDRAGNVGHGVRSVDATGFAPSLDGRMTVGGTHDGPHGAVSANGTLRCNGSPNRLTLQWEGGSMTVDQFEAITCAADPSVAGQRPAAPFDTMRGVGSGVLGDGTRATVAFTFVDAGEPGVHDRVVLLVTQEAATVLSSSGTLRGGNLQAHGAQGNGANTSGCLHGPGGNTTATC